MPPREVYMSENVCLNLRKPYGGFVNVTLLTHAGTGLVKRKYFFIFFHHILEKIYLYLQLS